MADEGTAARTLEGALIRMKITAQGRSVRAVARDIPISDTQLRNWYMGRDTKGEIVNFSARNLARTAQVLHIPSSDLIEVGRPDAAAILDQLNELEGEPAVAYTPEEAAALINRMSKRIGDLELQIQHLLGEDE